MDETRWGADGLYSTRKTWMHGIVPGWRKPQVTVAASNSPPSLILAMLDARSTPRIVLCGVRRGSVGRVPGSARHARTPPSLNWLTDPQTNGAVTHI